MIYIIQQIEIEGPGTLNYLARRHASSVKTVIMEKGQQLPEITDCTGIIVLGGPMNVYEHIQYPFLAREEHFLEEALMHRIPTLGICLGAQLLAKISGGSISKAPCEELGWYTLRKTEEAKEDRLFKGLRKKLEVFQWHGDTFTLPDGATLLAQGNDCINQAARFTETSWGLQFHPELNARMIKDWVKYYKTPLNLNKLLEEYFIKQDLYLQQAKTLFSNFFGFIESRLTQSNH